jgi:hypothetical protein
MRNDMKLGWSIHSSIVNPHQLFMDSKSFRLVTLFKLVHRAKTFSMRNLCKLTLKDTPLDYYWAWILTALPARTNFSSFFSSFFFHNAHFQTENFDFIWLAKFLSRLTPIQISRNCPPDYSRLLFLQREHYSLPTITWRKLERVFIKHYLRENLSNWLHWCNTFDCHIVKLEVEGSRKWGSRSQIAIPGMHFLSHE